MDETYENLPLGENNRLIDSHLHHNRVAGALVSYQKDFVADNNYLAWNGHEADGGTGYGITAMAGSYNFGVTFTNNTTDHNYRKGLDVHDGNDILIANNTAIGDRLYGIAVYNRQFTWITSKSSTTPLNRIRISAWKPMTTRVSLITATLASKCKPTPSLKS